MRYIRLLRAVSVFAVVVSSIAALLVGAGVSAQVSPLPANAVHRVSTTDYSNVSFTSPSTSSTNSTNALNWAGYVAIGGTYTSVSGSWVVPTVQSAGVQDVADATWIGIGGVESTDLIQAGTEAIPDTQGTLVYQAWYETLPQDTTAVPLAISPGDAISVSITEVGDQVWEISFDDATTGKTYQIDVKYDSSLSSADWIEEMPVEVGGIIGLDDFGTVNFTSGYAIKNGQAVTIRSAGATPLTMNNSQGDAVATPSVLGSEGSSFSVSRTDAPSTPLALSRYGVTSIAGLPSPSAYVSRANSVPEGYVLHMHRGRGGYRLVVQL